MERLEGTHNDVCIMTDLDLLELHIGDDIVRVVCNCHRRQFEEHVFSDNSIGIT